MNQSGDITCVVLAAGTAQRFGSQKLLHRLDDGNTLLQTTIERYLDVFESINVVVASQLGAVAGSISSPRVRLIENSHSQAGMSQSIIAGVAANQASSGWLIALGDMPYVQTSTIERLIAAFAENSIVVPQYKQRSGNPVLFSSRFKRHLLSLNGDIGAKKIVLDNQMDVMGIETDDSGIFLDIDIPKDIIRR